MEETLEYLAEVLEASVNKNGEKPLTNKYLLNIVKIAIKNQERFIEQADEEYETDL